MPSLVELRAATLDDADAIYDLLMGFYAENGVGKLYPAGVRQKIAALCDPSNGMIVCAILGGRIVGCMGIELRRWFWSEQWTLAEVWTYVMPAARRSSAALRMLKEANAIAERYGVPFIFGVFTPVDTNRKKRLFSRFGREFGATYVGGAVAALERG